MDGARGLPDTGRGIKPSADVFSFGHIVSFILTGTRPFHQEPKDYVKASLSTGWIPAQAWPQDWPLAASCRKLVDQCMHLEPKQRPRMEEVAAAILTWPDIASRDQVLLPGELH